MSVAAVGLTMCNSGHAFDPAPVPLMCHDSDGGNDLDANADLLNERLTIRVHPVSDGQWKQTPSVSNVVGGNVISIDVSPFTATIILDLSDTDGGDGGASTSGSFRVSGQITDNRTTCTVSRTFNFTIQSGGAQFSLLVGAHFPSRTCDEG